MDWWWQDCAGPVVTALIMVTTPCIIKLHVHSSWSVYTMTIWKHEINSVLPSYCSNGHLGHYWPVQLLLLWLWVYIYIYKLQPYFSCLSCMCIVASFPGPHPASRRLQYHTTSDGKLGEGLRMRLCVLWMYTSWSSINKSLEDLEIKTLSFSFK